MTLTSVICAVLLILLGIVLLCLATVWLEKHLPGKSHDERQEQSQGRAYRLSFGIGLIYFGFVTALLMAQQKMGQIIEPYLLVFGGILLQVTVFRIYCMITQSFMCTFQKPIGAILFDLIMGIVTIGCYRISEKHNLLEEMGYPASYEWIFLVLGVMFLFFTVCWLGQFLWQRLRGERE